MRTRTKAGRCGGSVAAEHAEWLGLIDVSGPFLSIKVLLEAFPQGLDRDDTELAKSLRQRLNEWQDSLELRKRDPGAHDSFVRFVLADVLELPDDLLQEGPQIPPTAKATLGEYRVKLAPKFTVGVSGQTPVLLIDVQPPGTGLDKALPERGFHASPNERMRLLLRHTGVKSGLVTNGEKWTLVHAPGDRTATFATWDANDLLDERLTLRAFRSLLGRRRLIGLDPEDTLDALLERSRDDEREVTDQLGNQVRRAVELLVSAIDRADRDTDAAVVEEVRRLERNEPAERTIYEAVVTTCMRLIFLLAAEARGLLPDDEPWIESYAVTPLRAELQQIADRTGEELLDRRFDAWPRLLSTFRAVHGGVEHERVRLPGYGGGLFDPDRYPFLETAGGQTLRISNRVILRVLDAIQTLQVDVPGGGKEPRPLSYKGLGVEQIGHVYERLLDHTALRADAPAVGLVGTAKKEPEIAVALLERARAGGEAQLLDLLKEETGRSLSALKRALDAQPAPERADALAQACGHDATVVAQIRPYLGLVRGDVYGAPTVFLPGSVYVTESLDRAATGAHYTPPSLTEPIVQYALEPVVFRGPAEGKPREEWELKRPEELLALKVCDIAMGSGAFLVAACRYLAARLVESWENNPQEAPADAGRDFEEQRLTAMRLVAERCLYGVDVNPLAVEIAKVSLWLTTLRRDRPFTFVDHALRCGDSLLGLTSLNQLEALALKPEEASSILLEPAREAIRATLDEVRQLREQIESTDAVDLREVEAKTAALGSADRELGSLKTVGDIIVGAALEEAAGKSRAATVVEGAVEEIYAALAVTCADRNDALLERVKAQAGDALLAGSAPGALDPPRPFHWALEFPEVFGRENGGFDAIVGNPPFLGGVTIAARLGTAMERFLKQQVPESRGFVDLVAYFHRRADILAASGGTYFLFGPQTLISTANRRAAIDPVLARDRKIVWGLRRLVWPGEATIEVCVVGITASASRVQPILDGESVSAISAGLESSFDVTGAPRLKPRFVYSEGTHLYGLGFVKTQHEWRSFLAHEPQLAKYLRAYVNADILCSSPVLTGDRIAVDFGERDKSELLDVRDALALVEQEVAQERAAQTRQIHEHRAWLFWDKRTELYAQARKFERIIVCPNLSKHLPFLFADPQWLFTKAVKFFATDRYEDYGVLQSSFFFSWVVATSPLRGNRIAFSTRNSLDTYVAPTASPELEEAARKLWETRASMMVDRSLGITSLLNLVHDLSDNDPAIDRLRALQSELDLAVANAYGWKDLKLDHAFRETPLGLRYTISEGVKTDVLKRLLELNHERYAEEVARGLHTKAGARDAMKAGSGRRSGRDGTTDDTLFS
jgi:hypothetical protein